MGVGKSATTPPLLVFIPATCHHDFTTPTSLYLSRFRVCLQQPKVHNAIFTTLSLAHHLFPRYFHLTAISICTFPCRIVRLAIITLSPLHRQSVRLDTPSRVLELQSPTSSCLHYCRQLISSLQGHQRRWLRYRNWKREFGI